VGWSRIDDLLPHHPKIMAAGSLGPTVLGFYVASIALAQRLLTDGVLLRRSLRALIPTAGVPTQKVIAMLESCGLWDPLTDGQDGWQIHDYLEFNDSAEVRKSRLAKDAARKRIPTGIRSDSARNPVAPPTPTPTPTPTPIGKRQDIYVPDAPDAPPPPPSGGVMMPTLRDQARTVLAFLNERASKSYRPAPATLKLIEARLASGATVQQCKAVIARKIREWHGDAKMRQYLRPETLFGATKFESYLGEMPAVKPEDA
jgi:uncharacterized phage protein (TIGR02220 family)